ncbi:MAG: response regulator [Kiritimatiellaeota bacterium]|nr:response regulator [Kiritimatiellota bacterium]
MAYILMVEDDLDFTEAVATVLGADNHEVQIVSEPAKVIPLMKERRPDLVILDVMFPEDPSGGFRLARKIHNSQPSLQSVPILLLTAVNARFPLGFSAEDIDDAWLPAADFLEKPVDFDVLREKVTGLLEKSVE